MSLTFPPSITQHLLINYRSTPNDETIKKPMSTGPQRIRLRDNVRYDTHSGEIVVTAAQRETFFDFYHDDHFQGAEPFEWRDPNTGATKLFRILEPQEENLGGGYKRISFLLEEVPS